MKNITSLIDKAKTQIVTPDVFVNIITTERSQS